MHHHGTGHRRRFESLREATASKLVAVSELAIDGGVRLPSDVPEEVADPTAHGTLHWAPLGTEPAAERLATMVDWVRATQPVGAIVDVSVEAALGFRLAGLPIAVVRQHGRRDDPPHRLAYAMADRLLAPYPPELEDEDTPVAVRRATTYLGFVSRYRCRRPVEPLGDRPAKRDVVVLSGSGGGELGPTELSALQRATQPHRVHVLGATSARTAVAGVRHHGWVDDPGAYLLERPVVVSAAGNNSVSDIAVLGCPLVVVPQPRPFDEQHAHADTLERRGLAASLGRGTPDPDRWRSAIHTARQRCDALHGLALRDPPAAAARRLDDLISMWSVR